MPRIKLRFKLIFLLVSLAVLPLVVAMMIIIVRFQNTQRENVISHNKKSAEVAAQEVNTFITSQFKVLQNIGIVYPELSINTQLREIVLERFLYQTDDFVDLAIVDASGQEISRKNIFEVVAANDLKDRSKNIEFLASKETGHYIGPVYLSQGKPFFILGEGIRGPGGAFGEGIRGVGGDFRGAVFAQVDARIMQGVVKRVSAAGRQGRAYIVNKNGIVVAHANISEVLAEKDFSYLPAVSAAIRGESPVKLSETYRNELGELVLGAGVPIVVSFPHEEKGGVATDWFVIVEQSASVALKVVRETTRFALALLFALLIIAIGAVKVFTRQIVRPVEQLYLASKKFGAGDLTYRVDIRTSDELEDLADGFNQMAENLGQSRLALEEVKNALEVRVKARTKELKELAGSLDEQVREKTAELQKRVKELENFQKLTVGRELKMVELKEEIKKLQTEFEKRSKV